MFLILKSTDWKEEDYIKGNIIPFGWIEDNNRAISRKKEVLMNSMIEVLAMIGVLKNLM